MDEVSRPVIAIALIPGCRFHPDRLGVVDQHLFPNRQSSSTGSNRDRTTVKKSSQILH
jgi:hypothetical protein